MRCADRRPRRPRRLTPLASLGLLVGMVWLTTLDAATPGATATAMPAATPAPAAATAAQSAAPLVAVRLQRYSMGTMIDLLAYTESAVRGEQALEKAMQEIERLDRVLSHFKADSDLSRLNRDGARGFVRVDPSLYALIEQAIAWSHRTGGRFDVTVGPLMRLWAQAYERGEPPAAAAIAAAAACVGADRIELAPPDRVRFRSDCLAIDLGGIGKGYAVDRALALLQAEGIDRALINAGGSSIGALGTPPGEDGWPVRLGAPIDGRDVLLLRDASMSTSQQHPRAFARAAGGVADIVDPRTGTPVAGRTAVTVVIANGPDRQTPGATALASGTAAEALSKALLMLSPADAAPMLAPIPDLSALWISPAGELAAAYRDTRLPFAGAAPRAASHAR